MSTVHISGGHLDGRRVTMSAAPAPQDTPMTNDEAWGLVARFLAEQRASAAVAASARMERYAAGLQATRSAPAGRAVTGPPTATLSEADRRRMLACTPLGRQVLADERERDPAAFAAAGGLAIETRRRLLSGGHIGQAMLADEDRKRRAR